MRRLFGILACSLCIFLAHCGPQPAAAGEPGGMAPQASAREVIATDAAPPAVGPYSQAIKVGDTIYCAGQVGLDPETRALVEGGIEAETRRALENLKAVLEAGGFTMADVVQAQVFLADINDFAAMNGVYATYFPEAPPARATVEVANLPLNARVEIMVTAVKADG